MNKDKKIIINNGLKDRLMLTKEHYLPEICKIRLPAPSPFLERGGTGILSINITPQVQSGFLWPQPQAWLIYVLLPAGWITLLGFIIFMGGENRRFSKQIKQSVRKFLVTP